MVGVLTCFAASWEYDEAEIVSGLCAVAAHIGTFLSRQHAEGLPRSWNGPGTTSSRWSGTNCGIVDHDRLLRAVLLACDDLDPDTAELLGAVDRKTAPLTATVDDLLDFAARQRRHGHAPATYRSQRAGAREPATRGRRPGEPCCPRRRRPGRADHRRGPGRLRQSSGPAVQCRQDSPDAVPPPSASAPAPARPRSASPRPAAGSRRRNHPDVPYVLPRHQRPLHHVAEAGPGLVIGRDIVDAHGGVISAGDDDPGTIITVRLPVTAGTRRLKAQLMDQPLSPVPRGASILEGGLDVVVQGEVVGQAQGVQEPAQEARRRRQADPAAVSIARPWAVTSTPTPMESQKSRPERSTTTRGAGALHEPAQVGLEGRGGIDVERAAQRQDGRVRVGGGRPKPAWRCHFRGGRAGSAWSTATAWC